MKAKKLKIRVKTDKYSIPIPALRFSTFRWISKQIIKHYPSKRSFGSTKSGVNEVMSTIFDNLTQRDIDQIFDQLEQVEPFELLDIEADDEKEGKVKVQIYTI